MLNASECFPHCLDAHSLNHMLGLIQHVIVVALELGACVPRSIGIHFEVLPKFQEDVITTEAAETSSNTQLRLPTGLEEIRGETSPVRPQQCVHDGRRCGHTLTSSVLWCHHFRVPALTRVTAYGTVIFELFVLRAADHSQQGEGWRSRHHG